MHAGATLIIYAMGCAKLSLIPQHEQTVYKYSHPYLEPGPDPEAGLNIEAFPLPLTEACGSGEALPVGMTEGD